jgi:uncharacterized protein (DUF1499 family)
MIDVARSASIRGFTMSIFITGCSGEPPSNLGVRDGRLALCPSSPNDVEFTIDDAAKVFHVRSAARLGKSDFGVNRKRVDEIRRAWKTSRQGLSSNTMKR